jgi:hypothetical protein
MAAEFSTGFLCAYWNKGDGFTVNDNLALVGYMAMLSLFLIDDKRTFYTEYGIAITLVCAFVKERKVPDMHTFVINDIASLYVFT